MNVSFFFGEFVLKFFYGVLWVMFVLSLFLVFLFFLK